MWVILKWVLGPLGKWFEYRSEKAKIEGEVMEETIRADIQLNALKVQMRAIDQGWWGTRWIVPGFAYPLIAWWACVIADSIYQFPAWNVARLPDPLMDWAGAVMMSFFVVRGAEIGVSALRSGVISTIAQRIFGKSK